MRAGRPLIILCGKFHDSRMIGCTRWAFSSNTISLRVLTLRAGADAERAIRTRRTTWSLRSGACANNSTSACNAYPPYTLLGTLNNDGETYAYYRAGDTTPGLAYIARWRAIVDGAPTAWTPLTIATGGQQNATSMVTVTKAAGASYTIGVETQIRFVKRSTALVPGYQQNIFDPIYVRHYQKVGTDSFHGSGTYRISQMTAKTTTFDGGGTCTTPDVSVNLGNTPIREFAGIGTTAARTPFNLSFQNCPPGMASIDYSFSATTSVLDAANGVVGLDASSTASGVGIQLLTQSGNAVQFGTPYPLNAYDPGQTANYSVEMQAGYYQTGTSVSPGRANTAITFTMIYK